MVCFLGSECEETVKNLMAIGYDRDQVVKALKASYNNPDRAAEYLLSVSLAQNRGHAS